MRRERRRVVCSRQAAGQVARNRPTSQAGRRGSAGQARLRMADDADSLELLDRTNCALTTVRSNLISVTTAEVARHAEKALEISPALVQEFQAVRRTPALHHANPADSSPSNEDLAARCSTVACRVSKSCCGGSRFRCCISCGASDRNDAGGRVAGDVSAGLFATAIITGRSGGSRRGCSRLPGEPVSIITGGRSRQPTMT